MSITVDGPPNHPPFNTATIPDGVHTTIRVKMLLFDARVEVGK
jgi:hypothetical protein